MQHQKRISAEYRKALFKQLKLTGEAVVRSSYTVAAMKIFTHHYKFTGSDSGVFKITDTSTR